jgi:hypothetical protein
VIGLTLVLSACGGGGDDGGTVNPGQPPIICACFTVNSTVNFAMASSGVPSGSVGINRSTAGPMTYKGQAVMGQTYFYPDNFAETNYWTVASNGATFIAYTNSEGTVTPYSVFFPQNMTPGQTVTSSSNTRYTLVGFENLSLAGKTFFNTCHFRQINTDGSTAELWFAPGYGNVKEIFSIGLISQYSGGL